MTAYVGHENIYERISSYVDLDEDAEYPFLNAINNDLFSMWKFGVSGTSTLDIRVPSSEPVNYIAIYGHNLDGVQVTVSYRVSFGYTQTASFVVSGEGAIFEKFAETSDTGWKVDFSGLTGDEYITSISLGKALELKPLRAPFTPPDLFDNYEIINNQSIDSIPLGRVTRKAPVNVKIPQSLASKSWIDEHVPGLADHINQKPFFFKWDDSSDNACICWTVKPFKPPTYNNSKFQSFMIEAKGFR